MKCEKKLRGINIFIGTVLFSGLLFTLFGLGKVLQNSAETMCFFCSAVIEKKTPYSCPNNRSCFAPKLLRGLKNTKI